MLGGAPAGQLVLKKTKTKDLARALGLPIYVFNCSEQMNYQSWVILFADYLKQAHGVALMNLIVLKLKCCLL